MKKYNKTKRLWLTREQRRELARKNIVFLRTQLSESDWIQIFNDTVSTDSSYNIVINEGK